MNFEAVTTALQTVVKYIDKVRNITNNYTTSSLADVTKLTRVEPLTILSKDLINLEYIPDVNNTLLNLFSAYYLQAVSILTKVNNVDVIRILDKLNPDRDGSGFMAQYAAESISKLSLESYKHSLPMTGVVALEASDKNNLNDVNNLAVGKLLNVNISVPGRETTDGKIIKEANVELQIAVRLMTSVIPDNAIQQLLTAHSDDNSVVERYHAWRAGRIGFIKDLIFCSDLIDEWKRTAVKDTSDTMMEIVRRVNNSKKYGLLTNNPSLVSASNLFVISEEVARAVESKLGGKLSNPRTREKAFDSTYAMVIAVVDREYERVTFYTRGIASSTDLSIKEIKAAAKGKGPDIMEIFKSMQIGAPAAF